MEKDKIGLITIVVLLASMTSIFAYDCSDVTQSGSYGSVSGGNVYGCINRKYHINFGRTMAVKLTWNSFDDIPGDMPYCTDGNLKVYAGCGSWLDQTQIAEFCSGNMISSKPHDIYAYTNCLTLELENLDSYSSNGTFSATWEGYTGSSSESNLHSCTYSSGSYDSSKGVMRSPSWPTTSYMSSCSWNLDRSASNGYLIHVMDIKDQSYCSSNRQQVKITDSDENKYGTDICTRENVFIRFFKPKVTLRYNKGFDWNNRGFVVGWVAFKNPYYTDVGAIGGYITAVILIPIIIVCAIVCCCLKQKRGYVFSQRAQSGTMAPQTNTMAVINTQQTTNTGTGGQINNCPSHQYAPPTKQGYPPQQPAYPPPQQEAYPPQQGNAPPPQPGAYPPQQPGQYPPPQGVYPPPVQGYPPVSQQEYAPPPTYQESQSQPPPPM